MFAITRSTPPSAHAAAPARPPAATPASPPCPAHAPARHTAGTPPPRAPPRAHPHRPLSRAPAAPTALEAPAESAGALALAAPEEDTKANLPAVTGTAAP